MQMDSFPEGYRALVIGASGGIGAALVETLRADPRCASVTELARSTIPPLDLTDPTSIGQAAAEVAHLLQLAERTVDRAVREAVGGKGMLPVSLDGEE